MTKAEIITAIESYARNAGLAPATVTGRAAGNSRLYARLKAGGGCGLDTAERIKTWINANPPKPTEDAA